MPDSRRPTFSVVIPVYERAATVLPTLRSVADQTVDDWECIVVDDGSSDGEHLERVVADLADGRFRYVRRPNGGGGAARNTGVEAARGRYVAFLDSDDRFLPEKLETVLAVVHDGARCAYYSYVWADRGNGRAWRRPDRPLREGEPAAEYLFVANQVIQTSSIVLPIELAREVPFDPDLRKGQDLDLCVRLADARVPFEMIERPLVVWTDASEENRTSRHRGSAAAAAWLERARPWMSPRAYHGYRATVLAYYQAEDRPWAALYGLIDGGIRGRVPARILARQALRCFVPRTTYRRIVDRFVRARGRRLDADPRDAPP